MLTLDVLTVIGFVAAFIGVSAATADVTGIEKRLRRLDRGDPATAEAVRRAQAVTDLARGGFFGLESIVIVCTPSRRNLHLSGDDEVETVTAPPVRPAAIASTPQGRHLVARRARPRRRLARGIRRLLATRAGRTARATSRPPAGSR
ncbi:hypothetical protein LQ757_10420 [Agromyces sp. SYSU K20354]|uniref:hypothetical protein n=1 Tax=Agromyces cavernae TaxID=2898659 RepID=UPI001E497B8F|nr:hypothetical protein [Agromyces cavernae]MCD2442686.1 hypothetical protein [Agromyces cavernae]